MNYLPLSNHKKLKNLKYKSSLKYRLLSKFKNLQLNNLTNMKTLFNHKNHHNLQHQIKVSFRQIDHRFLNLTLSKRLKMLHGINHKFRFLHQKIKKMNMMTLSLLLICQKFSSLVKILKTKMNS